MDELIWQGLLFDFYGDLLTETQRAVFSEYVNEDFTITEIAQRRGVSRQSIHEALKRTEAVLTGYEETLGLIAKFTDAKVKLEALRETISGLSVEAATREMLWCRIDEIMDGM
ncbi:MAG: sigma factor-like helix-turn-helix DNA-binding protein [Eubacteriales bacterium]|nr:sigma factor-like helix-turn-helix DNA-binding protein [Eubacteriales bacterium]